MIMKRLAFSALVLAFCFNAIAQANKLYYYDNSVKVFAGGQEQTLAWCGGFNNPQFCMADLNNDALQDLVVFEPGKGIKTFINKGSIGHPDYRFAPDYALNFPPISDYLNLSDYNCDHIPDLFHQGSTGFSVYKGYYNTANMLCFTYYEDLYYSNDTHIPGVVNAFNNPGDIPAIVDVDNDGDLDFISYDISAGKLNFFRNMRVELGLPCDSIRIELKDRCWGKVYQGFYRTHTLGFSCDNSGLLRGTLDTAGKLTHSGNTPCLFDWDLDGDYDYLDGSVSFNEMTFLKNGRIENGGIDSMIYQDTMWQTGGTTISLPVWPAAFNVDIDQDGLKDLVISPNAINASENYRCVWYYHNQSTPGSPNWQFMSDTFMVDKAIDLGTAAYPMLFDYNKDGKPDLFVGSDGYRQPNGLLRSRISYYENTSTPGNPSFTLRSKDFLNIDTFNFQGMAPAFGDIDHDGKADLVMGHTNGTLSYFKNMAASDTVQPIWQPTAVTLTDYAGTPINVTSRAAPFVYDVDKDGRQDLVIGSIYGTMQYYQNISTTPGSVMLKLVNDRLGGAKADPTQVVGCFSTPFIGRIDSSGRDYLLMGSNSGNIYRFDSVSSGDTSVTYPMLESQYSFIDSEYLLYNHPSSPLAAYGNLRSAVTVGDVDGDGDLEMIVGTIRGGLEFYKRKVRDNAGITLISEHGKLLTYPNPVSDLLQISWSGMLQPSLKLSVTNIQGQVVYTAELTTNAQRTSIPVSSLPSGLYICNLFSGANRYHNKFTVLH